MTSAALDLLASAFAKNLALRRKLSIGYRSIYKHRLPLHVEGNLSRLNHVDVILIVVK